MLGTTSNNVRNATRNRILLVLGMILYPAWWGVFRIASPGANDPILGRLGVALFLLIILIASFWSDRVMRNLNRLIIVCGAVITLHYFYLLHLNYADTNYLLAAFVTVFAISTCFITRQHFLAFMFLVIVLSSLVCAVHPEIPKLVFMGGMLTGVIISYVALASRLRVFESLLKSEERFRTMANTAPVMIWMSDDHGACNFFNEVWTRFTGISAEEAYGNGWTKSIHPDDLNGYLEKYFSAFRARRSFQGEYRLRRADGHYRRIFAENTPLLRSDGKLEGYIGTCVDITAANPVSPNPANPA